MSRFVDALHGGVLVLDGAMGTTLQARGLMTGLCPEELNATNPDAIRAIYRSYVEAGADIIETNSFGGSRLRLAHSDLADRAYELNLAAARLAREVAGERVFVAGSIGPLAAILEPFGDVSGDEARDAFAEQAAALAAGGVDLILIETMYDLTELQAAVEGARTTGLPIICSMTFDRGGRTMMGVSPAQAVRTIQAWEGVVALGTNCGNGPEETEAAIREMLAAGPRLPLVAYPNAGLPELVGEQVHYRMGPEAMAEFARRFVDLGVRVVGSCCGSTPAHTRAIADAARGLAAAV